MSALRWAGPAFLVLGLALVIAAVVTGSARLDVVLVFPVFVGGASVLFFGGVAALFLGIFLLPLAFAGGDDEPEEPSASPGPTSSGGSGGLVLIGPFPIFFGSWKNPGRRAYWVAALVGAMVLIVAFAVAWAVS